MSEQDLWTSTGAFLQNTLKLNITGEQIISISRPSIPSGFRTKDEALVVFTNAEVRDTVLGSSNKLAPMMDERRQPTAGIRLEIPAGLRPAFKILDNYGQMLRRRHGVGTRRHVKFNDLDCSLFLNIKLPGDDKWSKVTLDMARRGVLARERLVSDELEKRLDVSGEPVDGDQRQRASSTGAMDTSTWTARPQGR